MFVRNHLAVITRWARSQLREGVESPEVGAQLKQLVEAAEALHARMHAEAATGPNVVALEDFRQRTRPRKRSGA
jgi:hypothetical protein